MYMLCMKSCGVDDQSKNPIDNLQRPKKNASRQTGGNEYFSLFLVLYLSVWASARYTSLQLIWFCSMFFLQSFYCCFLCLLCFVWIAIKNKSKGLDWAISINLHTLWTTHSFGGKNEKISFSTMLLFYFIRLVSIGDVSMFSLPAIICCFLIVFFSSGICFFCAAASAVAFFHHFVSSFHVCSCYSLIL